MHQDTVKRPLGPSRPAHAAYTASKCALRGLSKDEVAPLVDRLLSDEASYVSGAEITLDGGCSAHGGVKAITNAIDGQ